MIYFVKFIYQTFLLPPGIIIILLALLAVWLSRGERKAKEKGNRKAAAWAAAAIALILYLVSTPLVGKAIINPLESKYTPPDKLEGDVLVMLGGGSIPDTPNISGLGHLSGSAANRLLTCAQLSKKYGLPVIISGGQVYDSGGVEADIAKTILKDLGIAEDKIIPEQKSLNTSQNAANTKELLDRYGFRKPVLVTSAFHMDRAVRQFEKAGIKVIPYPTDYQSGRILKFELRDLIPDAEALTLTSISLKEYIGILMVKWY